jgi:tetratricopeptide (TPR) repeat protein
MTSQSLERSPWLAPLPAVALITLLVVGWFVYQPALTGTFLLDDHSNLAGLQSVTDTRSALYFVLTGDAGPLGRPLALASFLPQASAWGLDATPFIRVNILVHLLNGLLVFVFSKQLARVVLRDQGDILLLAFATTAVWLFMPLLASSSLLIVQRMTTLSATFVLLGLNAYMIARQRIDTRPNAALVAMSLALVIATLLATLTKENGALLPVFVLVLEATTLRHPQSLSLLRWNIWRGLFLGAPALLILTFLLLQVPYSEDIVARREFTAFERLFNEARILWEYLFNAFFGWSGRLGPFHESRPVRNPLTDPLTVVATGAWLVIVGAALRMRRRYGILAFATLWFLAGHVIESTTLPLELYFEHRNYLPVIGPVFALCYGALSLRGRFNRIARACLVAYIVINAGVLYGVTSLWGKPLLAATYWHERDPVSVRAATTLATQQLSQLGPETAVDTLRKFASQNPKYSYIRIPELNLACSLRPEDNHTALLAYLRSQLPTAAFSLTTGEMLDQLLTTAAANDCESLSPATVGDLAAAVMKNPRYRASVLYNQSHHILLARIARVSGDNDETLEHLARAIEIGPSDRLDMMMVTTLVAAERFEEARRFIEDAADDLPRMPLKRYNSKRNLNELKTYIDETEKLAETSVRQPLED